MPSKLQKPYGPSNNVTNKLQNHVTLQTVCLTSSRKHTALLTLCLANITTVKRLKSIKENEKQVAKPQLFKTMCLTSCKTTRRFKQCAQQVAKTTQLCKKCVWQVGKPPILHTIKRSAAKAASTPHHQFPLQSYFWTVHVFGSRENKNVKHGNVACNSESVRNRTP